MTLPEERPSRWLSENLFFDGDAYFASIVEKINRAQNFIQVESYIFEVDQIGVLVIEALGKAVRRRVLVHIIVDGIGSIDNLAALKDQCGEHGFHLRVYHPIPFIEGGLKKLSLKSLGILFGLFKSLNKRNHRKVINIDGVSAFLGSYNISKVHSKAFMGEKAWNDVGVFVEGPAIRELTRAFSKAWLQYRILLFPTEKIAQLPKDEKRLIRLNSKIYWRYALLNDLIRRVEEAKNRVLITNAYFLPRRRLVKALALAARRGVTVGICVPAKSDVWIVRVASKFLYYKLLKDGVFIYEYKPTMLHAKTLVIDDWATVGSHNFNHRSFVHDLEADAVITYPENIKLLCEKWSADISRSNQIKILDLGKFTIWQRIVIRIAYWFRYWI